MNESQNQASQIEDRENELLIALCREVADIQRELRALNRENELLIALCREVGDVVSDEECIAGMRSNHQPALIHAAAEGDVAALVQLRSDCGLRPLV